MRGLAMHDLGGTGRPLVVIHGYTGSSEDFRGVVGPLTELRRVILLDQLGHGDSPRAPSYDFGALTRAILEVLLLEIREPADLLGHSMGGRTILPIAIGQPELVRSLILMDTWADSPERGEEVIAVREALAIGDDEAAYAELLRAWDSEPGISDELVIARWGAEWAAARLASNRGRLDPRAAVHLGRQVFGEAPSVLEACARISCPTTVLWGSLDASFVGPAERMLAAIPGARPAIIHDAYHSPQLTHPEEWIAAVREHLEG